LRIILAYLDHKSADINVREKFSFTTGRIREILKDIVRDRNVSGAVLLSTCNRTELYISSQNASGMDLVQLLCKYSGAGERIDSNIFNIKYDNDAILHLMGVACGLESMVLCEDQIITQVGDAVQTAREEKSTDSVLETIFRLAVTAAKKAKTTVRVKAVPGSAAESAVNFIATKCKLDEKKVLVIGNGETGRLCCRELLERGAEVTVTLRKYKYGDTIVPFGCKTIAYDERAGFMPNSDIVISATLSPHYTITCDMVRRLERKPAFFVDLALPRDIDPDIKGITGIESFNLDDFCSDYEKANLKEIGEIRQIIQEHLLRYLKWKSYTQKPIQEIVSRNEMY
jgi:glutamyl-tRNA reductase